MPFTGWGLGRQSIIKPLNCLEGEECLPPKLERHQGSQPHSPLQGPGQPPLSKLWPLPPPTYTQQEGRLLLLLLWSLLFFQSQKQTACSLPSPADSPAQKALTSPAQKPQAIHRPFPQASRKSAGPFAPHSQGLWALETSQAVAGSPLGASGTLHFPSSRGWHPGGGGRERNASQTSRQGSSRTPLLCQRRLWAPGSTAQTRLWAGRYFGLTQDHQQGNLQLAPFRSQPEILQVIRTSHLGAKQHPTLPLQQAGTLDL